MSKRNRFVNEDQPEDGDLGLGHGCQPGGLPPFEILRRRRSSSAERRPSESTVARDSAETFIDKRPTNRLTKLTSKLGFYSKPKCISQADDDRQEQPESDAMALGTSLKQQKLLFRQGLVNIQHRRNVDLQQFGTLVHSPEEKLHNVTSSSAASDLLVELQASKSEVESLRQQLEFCEKNLNSKHEAVQILFQQLQLASNDERLNKANEKNLKLIKALNKAQFELEHRQTLLLQSQQTWAARFDSACNEKLALQTTVDKLSREKKQLYAEKMSVCRERDELVALLNARERECFETLSSVGQKALGSDSSRHCGTTTAATSSNVTAVKDAVYQMAVLGSCQCDVAGSGPCACAQLTAQLMCDIALLNDQLAESRQKCEESLAMADAYRIAFDEQMSRNKSLANQLVRLYSPRNGHPATRKGTRLTGSRSVACITSETLSGSDDDDDLILSLTEMVSESREALAHQRLAARLLALRTQQLETRLSRLSDDCVTSGQPDGCNETGDYVSPGSQNCVTPNDAGQLDESVEAGSEFSRRSRPNAARQRDESNEAVDEFSWRLQNCMTANNGTGSQLQSSGMEEELSPMSETSATSCHIVENNELES